MWVLKPPKEIIIAIKVVLSSNVVLVKLNKLRPLVISNIEVIMLFINKLSIFKELFKIVVNILKKVIIPRISIIVSKLVDKEVESILPKLFVSLNLLYIQSRLQLWKMLFYA